MDTSDNTLILRTLHYQNTVQVKPNKRLAQNLPKPLKAIATILLSNAEYANPSHNTKKLLYTTLAQGRHSIQSHMAVHSLYNQSIHLQKPKQQYNMKKFKIKTCPPFSPPPKKRVEPKDREENRSIGQHNKQPNLERNFKLPHHQTDNSVTNLMER